MTHPGTEIFPPSALDLARGVDLLILDVDGVMTDGRLYYGDFFARGAPSGSPAEGSFARGAPSGSPAEGSLARGAPSGSPAEGSFARGAPSGSPAEGSEIKAFYAQDGAAIKMLQAAGVPVAIITGRASEATAKRASELGIAYAYQGVEDKTVALSALCCESGISSDRMAHAGDDIPDLPLFDRVGMRLSVPRAHPEVAARADYVTTAAAGAGAVREICHLILIAKGLWESALTAAGAWPR